MEEESEKKLTKKERKKLAKEDKRKKREAEARSSTVKKAAIWLLVTAGLVWGGITAWNWINTPTQPAGDYLQVAAGEHVKGADDPSVVVIEYGDFQCPACAAFAGDVSAISSEYSDEVQVVYRHFPLISIHKHALEAAWASEAASKQGKFWEMHDLLFAKQSEWENLSSINETFESYAQEIGLDVERYKSDFESAEVKEKVNLDLQGANSLRLNSTPTFFINGEKIQNPRNFDAFKSLIEAAM